MNLTVKVVRPRTRNSLRPALEAGLYIYRRPRATPRRHPRVPQCKVHKNRYHRPLRDHRSGRRERPMGSEHKRTPGRRHQLRGRRHRRKDHRRPRKGAHPRPLGVHHRGEPHRVVQPHPPRPRAPRAGPARSRTRRRARGRCLCRECRSSKLFHIPLPPPR